MSVSVGERRRNSSATGALQRAAIACQSCRSRKVKCDAQSVSSDQGCTPCRKAGQECLFDRLADGRRTVSLKFVDKLQQRIETLEALNQSVLNQPASGLNETGAASVSDASVLHGRQSVQHINTIDAGPPQSNDTPNVLPPQISHSPHPTLPVPTMVIGSSPKNTSGNSPSFYGATSHPHVVSPSENPNLAFLDNGELNGIDLDMDSPRLRDHLLRSFFKYQSLWVDIVNKESFLLHQANGSDSRWYSKFLENAMLACGTRLSTSRSVRALGPKYCEYAKSTILGAMSQPSPANLQGFLVLSEYEVTQGNDRPGWMFCGTACRMLPDLGLHELANVLGPPSATQDTTIESDLAYALLSACIIYEGVWTLYLGRPSSIPSSVMNTAVSRCKARQKSDSIWLNAWVGLCVPMAQVSHVLNDQSIDTSDRFDSLSRLFRQVEEWYERLPQELTYDENRLTNMDLAGYGLHTQYCKVQILLRQALAGGPGTRKRRYAHMANETRSQAFEASPHDSNSVIYQYALRIARLVVTYREAFGTEKIPSIMLDNAVVAATTMVQHLNQSDTTHETQPMLTWLRRLVKSMEMVHPHFPIIRRMIDSLRQICKSGLLQDMLPPTNQDPASPSTQELSASNQPFNYNPTSQNVRDNIWTLDLSQEMNWNIFDTNVGSDAFSSAKIGDGVLDFPPSEALIHSLSQAIP